MFVKSPFVKDVRIQDKLRSGRCIMHGYAGSKLMTQIQCIGSLQDATRPPSWELRHLPLSRSIYTHILPRIKPPNDEMICLH